MVLLLYAIIPCLAAYTVLVSLIFGTTIPTSFNILMKCFYFTCILVITLSDFSTSATADFNNSAPIPTSPPSPETTTQPTLPSPTPTASYDPVDPTNLLSPSPKL